MARRGREDRGSPDVGWRFWRRSFWKRPAFLITGGVLVAAATWLPGLALAQAITDSRALASGHFCAADGSRTTRGCLTVVRGDLEGPFHRRRTTRVDWNLKVGEESYGMSTGRGAIKALLQAADPVEGVLRDGRLLELRTPAGWERSDSVGGDGIVGSLGGLGLCIAVAFGAVLAGLEKTRTFRGWWHKGKSKRPEAYQLARWKQVLVAAGLGYLLMFLSWVVGVGWRTSVGLGAAATLLAAAWFVVSPIRIIRPAAGRHSL